MKAEDEWLACLRSGETEEMAKALCAVPAVELPLLKGIFQPEIKALFNAYRENNNGMDKTPGSNGAVSYHRNEKQANQVRCCGLAILAVGNLADAKALPWYSRPPERNLVALLKHRRPSWLDEWVRHLLDKEVNVHSLVKAIRGEGLSSIDNHPAQTLGYLRRSMRTPYASIQQDKELLEVHVWRLFEFEGGGDLSLAATDKYIHAEENTWAYAFCRLGQEGTLSRDRLLDASLEALSRGFGQFRAGWFSRFHEAMKPAVEERDVRGKAYLKLLASDTGPTVSFALNALSILQAAGRLNPVNFVIAVEPVFLSRQKGTILAAISLLGQAIRKNPESTVPALQMAIRGLPGAGSEVQGKILKFLQGLVKNYPAEVRAALLDQREAILPSLLKQYEALAGPAKGKFAVVKIQAEPFAQKAEVLERIEAIADLDELLDRAAYVLENPNDLEELERVFAGMLRFQIDPGGKEHPGAKTLSKRAAKLFLNPSRNSDKLRGPYFPCYLIQLWSDVGLRPKAMRQIADARRIFETTALMKEVLKFLKVEGEGNPCIHLFTKRSPLDSFHFRRCEELVPFLAQAKSLQLLASPTHRDFWIEAGDLVKRSKIIPGGAGIFDQINALLRLKRGGHEEALAQAGAVEGEWGEALRHALGGSEKPGKNAALWAAAARARHPGEDDEKVLAAFPKLDAGAGKIGRSGWELKENRWNVAATKFEPAKEYVHRKLRRRVIPSVSNGALEEAFSMSVYRDQENFSGQSKDPDNYFGHSPVANEILWNLACWPGGRDEIYAHAVLFLSAQMAYMEVSDQVLFLYLEALARPGEEFGPNARLLLNLGLSCLHPDGRAAAAQAFVEGVETGRLDPVLLATSMKSIFTTSLILPNRLRQSLDQIVTVSPFHARAVERYLILLLQGKPDEAPRQMVHLFELLRELLAVNDSVLSDTETIKYLEGFTSSKAGSIAKAILKEAAKAQHL